MTTIEATYRVTTPMFCGGADGQSAELRTASFKGVLRFWWRACAWSRLGGELGKIRKAEAHLFGSPDTGQSRVWVRFDLAERPRARPGHEVLTLDGATYLGFGLQALDGTTIRSFLPESFDLRVRLRCRGVDPAAMEILEDAVKALGMVGGMGARSRRGYGSLSLASLTVSGEGRAVPATPGELDHALARFHEEADDRLPEYTAFSGQSRHLVLRCGRTSATEVLNLLGIEYAAYRRGSGHASKRIPFGLPLKVSREKKPAVPDGYTRRASPLMFHIHQCEEEAVAVVSFLPARFLPRRKSTVIMPDRSRRPIDGTDALYEPVVGFLDHLARGHTFTPVMEVRR